MEREALNFTVELSRREIFTMPSANVALLSATPKNEKLVDLDIYTRGEVAQALHCSIRTVDTLVARRVVPHIKIGRLIRFRLSDVQRALNRLTIKEVS
jgi:excisionase family DNA binding protein